MGQQESHIDSPELVRRATGLRAQGEGDELSQPQPQTSQARSVPARSATARKMEKLLRRAQQLDPRRRRHQSSSSRRDSEQSISSGSSMDNTPRGSPAVRHGIPTGSGACTAPARSISQKSTASSVQDGQSLDGTSVGSEGGYSAIAGQGALTVIPGNEAPPTSSSRSQPSRSQQGEMGIKSTRGDGGLVIGLVSSSKSAVDSTRTVPTDFVKKPAMLSLTKVKPVNLPSFSSQSPRSTRQLAGIDNTYPEENINVADSRDRQKLAPLISLEDMIGLSPIDEKWEVNGTDPNKRTTSGKRLIKPLISPSSPKKHQQTEQSIQSVFRKPSDSLSLEENSPTEVNPPTVPAMRTPVLLKKDKVGPTFDYRRAKVVNGEAATKTSDLNTNRYEKSNDVPDRNKKMVDVRKTRGADKSPSDSIGTQSSPEDQNMVNNKLMNSSTASSLLSSPSDDVFLDAYSLDSPYMSAVESRQDTGSEQSPDSPEGTLVPDMRSSSMDNVDETSPHQRMSHKEVDASYPVKTSRMLSNSSQDTVRLRHSSGSGIEVTPSPHTNRKETKSEMEPDVAKPVSQPPKHSVSMDSGLESAWESKHFDDANIENSKHKDVILTDAESLRDESSTEQAMDDATKYSTWAAPYGNSEKSRYKGPSLSLKIKHKPKHTNEDVYVKRGTQSVPGTPSDVENGGVPGLQRPPSRSTSMSLDEVVAVPPTIPDKLDFRQLEKFEGKFSNDVFFQCSVHF